MAQGGNGGRCSQPAAEVIGEVGLRRLDLGQAMECSPLTHGSSHAGEGMVETMNRETSKTGMTVVGGRHPVGGGNSLGHELHRVLINMTYGVGPGAHGVGRCIGARCSIGHTILSGPALSGSGTTGRLASISWAGGRRRCLVKLLLVAEQQVTAGEASRTLRALERLLLGVGALMALEMF